MTSTSCIVGEFREAYGLAVSPGNFSTALGGSALLLGLAFPCFIQCLPANASIGTARRKIEVTGQARLDVVAAEPDAADQVQYWLRLAEPSFEFWDNAYDDAWNDV